MTKFNRTHVHLAVATTTGVALGLVAYRMGANQTNVINNLTKDLTAHVLIVTKIRETHPDVVDTAVEETIAHMNAILQAANQ